MARKRGAARIGDGVGNPANGRPLPAVRAEAIVDVEAPVLDIFLSRQGEGICVGDPQIFIRFGGCNVVCDYRDRPDSIPAKADRPKSVEGILADIEALGPNARGAAVSLTGGE